MNFFKRIFFKKVPETDHFREAEYNLNHFVLQPGSINVRDGFYMIKDACITCGAPEAEAPDLIEHANGGAGECYFKKQPETEDEVSQAMSAVMVSCVDALRYGGKDETILKRMYERGLADNCDYKLINTYAVVTRNIVTFYFEGTLNELANLITDSYVNDQNYKVIDYLNDKVMRFSFILKWLHFPHESLFVCTQLQNGFFKINLMKNDGTTEGVGAGHTHQLHQILKHRVFAQNILWYENEIIEDKGNSLPW